VGEAPVVVVSAIFEEFDDTTMAKYRAKSRERNETAMLTSLHNGTERVCDLARTVRNLFSQSILVDYANSVLALPLVEGICPFQKFSGMGLEAESSLRIIDCPCQLKGTASLRA
jgi:hypothetical protein